LPRHGFTSCAGVLQQLEVFYELNAATINANLRAADLSGAAAAEAAPEIFKSPEDRQFMLALVLHCADISNAVKPMCIAEKCAAPALPPCSRGAPSTLDSDTHPKSA
jgi:hypothetical protein